MDATKDSQLAIDFAKAAGFGAFVSKRSGLRAESCKDMQVLIVCFVGGGTPSVSTRFVVMVLQRYVSGDLRRYNLIIQISTYLCNTYLYICISKSLYIHVIHMPVPIYLYAYVHVYIYIWYPPHVPTPLCLNLSLREAWVRGIPLSPSLSPKPQVQDGVGVWDWGECLQIVTLFFHVWRVPSKIAPNHPNHFRIILIRARPWIQDPRSKIAHRSCAGNLGSWILDPGPNDSDDSVSFLLIRHLYCHDSYNIWSFVKYASHYIPQNTF